MSEKIPAEISEYFTEVQSIFRQLHSEPELLYDLPKTSSFVANYLHSLNIEVHEQIGLSGVVGVIRNPGPCIMLRADMDALPIDEETNLPYSSKTPGRMHACGHDSHVAMLLVAAKIISKMSGLKGSVKFVFQPAEEGGAGANAMIKDGVLENVDEAYGVHVGSPMKVNDYLYNDKYGSVNSDRFEVIIEGRGGHGSAPHDTIDSIPVAAHLLLAFNQIASNRQDLLKIQANIVKTSESSNAIPGRVEIKGCTRTLHDQDRKEIKERMRLACEGLEVTYNVRIRFVYEEVYNGLINSESCGKYCLKAAAKVCTGKRLQRILAIGEDFSYFSAVVPSAYILLGCADEQSPGNHSKMFKVEEETLLIGVAYWVALVKERLLNI